MFNPVNLKRTQQRLDELELGYDEADRRHAILARVWVVLGVGGFGMLVGLIHLVTKL